MLMRSVDIVIPIYYGCKDEIGPSINKQVNFFRKNLKGYKWTIWIGLNGENRNNILELCKGIEKKFKEVRLDYVKRQGRGESLRNIWLKSKADFVAYMDVDLATSLENFRDLLSPLENSYDFTYGNRYSQGNKSHRNLKRLIVSKIYNVVMINAFLGAKFNDAQCGFKALKTDVAKKIVPLIKDNSWFFDTELLYIAEKKGYNLKGIPVEWKEGSNSGVKIIKTSFDFIKKTIELKYRNV